MLIGGYPAEATIGLCPTGDHLMMEASILTENGYWEEKWKLPFDQGEQLLAALDDNAEELHLAFATESGILGMSVTDHTELTDLAKELAHALEAAYYD